jgi:multicomponent Na+:H+ antiporter subunit D
MVMGLALFTPLGLGGAVFYMVHNIFAKANLFLIAGIAALVRRQLRAQEARRALPPPSAAGGAVRHRRLLAGGLPAALGFWAKLVVIRAGFEAQAWPLVAVALFVGLLTLYSMTKIWLAAFWSPVPEGVTLRAGPAPALLYAPGHRAGAADAGDGLRSAPFFALAERIGAS